MSEGPEDNIVMTSALQEEMVKTLTRRWASLFMKFDKEEVGRIFYQRGRNLNENYDRQKKFQIFFPTARFFTKRFLRVWRMGFFSEKWRFFLRMILMGFYYRSLLFLKVLLNYCSKGTHRNKSGLKISLSSVESLTNDLWPLFDL